MEYITTYLPYVNAALDFLVYAHLAALVIVNATVTPKDNEILAKAYGYVEVLAGLIGYKAKI